MVDRVGLTVGLRLGWQKIHQKIKSMKTVIAIVMLWVGAAFGQTNWPMYRQVSGQVYNVGLSQKWRVVVPEDGHIKLGVNLKVGDRVTVVCRVVGVPGNAEIRNVPYNPAEWDFPPHKGVVTKGGLMWKVLAVEDKQDARGTVTKCYDYGVPVGTKERP